MYSVVWSNTGLLYRLYANRFAFVSSLGASMCFVLSLIFQKFRLEIYKLKFLKVAIQCPFQSKDEKLCPSMSTDILSASFTITF